MDSEFRRLIAALLVATGVFFAYQLTVRYLFPPPPPPPPTAPVAPTDEAIPHPPAAPTSPVSATAPASSAPASTGPASLGKGELPYVVSSADVAERHTLGGRDGDALRMELDPAGASVSSLSLFSRKPNGRFVHRRSMSEEEPFVLLATVDDGGRTYHAFDTQRIRVVEFNQAFDLDRANWSLASASATEAVFATALRDSDDRDLLRLRKTYALRDGKPIFTIGIEIENAGSQPLTVSIDQDGPMGMTEVDPAHDTRLLMSAQYDKANAALGLNRAYYHKELAAAVAKGDPVKLLMPDLGRLAWIVLSNKYFGVYMRPLPTDSSAAAGYVASVTGLVANPSATVNSGDMLPRLATFPVPLAPGATARYAFEVYAGAKDHGYIARIDPALAAEDGLNYPLAMSADRRCTCTFRWIEHLMVWLLEVIFFFVRNYGIAIIILVIIVRGLLHPLSVWQQKSMYRMQESMSRVQPRIDEIKEKYANDKVKLNQEMMKVFAEENVNPAGSLVAMVPLFLQMPILVALWTTLNTDVNLRHAPFDGWWIKDLSAPDAFISFATPVDVPILSVIPLIGWIFTGVRSINILPILMGVSMWLQQKYMPKPHLKAKLEASKNQPPKERKGGGMTPEEQMRQQQVMAYMMSIMFPLMFYSMPSGLNLYWMATNVFGICESLIIQRQLEQEKKRRELLGPQPPRPKKDGMMSRVFRNLAAQAEELQKKADELSRQEDSRKRDKDGRKGGGKP